MALISNSHICPRLGAILSPLNIEEGYNTSFARQKKGTGRSFLKYILVAICHCFDWGAIVPGRYRFALQLAGFKLDSGRLHALSQLRLRAKLRRVRSFQTF